MEHQSHGQSMFQCVRSLNESVVSLKTVLALCFQFKLYSFADDYSTRVSQG